LQEMQVPDT